MSRDDFRRLIDLTDPRSDAGSSGVAVEVDDALAPAPLVLSALGQHTATTLRLTEDEGRRLFDALAEALGLVTVAAAARAAAGDTATHPQD